MISIAAVSPESGCGNIGFKIEDETQSSFLSVNADSILLISTITDLNLVGTHYVKFEAYLKDLDPTGIYSKPVEFTLSI